MLLRLFLAQCDAAAKPNISAFGAILHDHQIKAYLVENLDDLQTISKGPFPDMRSDVALRRIQIPVFAILMGDVPSYVSLAFR